MKTTLFVLILVIAALHFAVANLTAASNADTFSGRIVAVDPKLQMFIVRGTHGVEEAFHPDKYSQFILDGQPVLLGQLEKGDQVTVRVRTER